MPSIIKEALFFVQQQHEWLVDLQSAISEKEQKYRMYINKLNYQLRKENKIQEAKKEFDERNEERKQVGDLTDEDINEYLPSTSGNNSINQQIPDSDHLKHGNNQADDQTEDVTVFIRNNDELYRAEIVENQLYENVLMPEQVVIKTEIDDSLFKQDSLDLVDNVHHLKTFKCLYCPRMFRAKSNKINHERIHTGEKPFKCDNCSKTFATRSSQIVHSRTHTGEKPFRCRFCGRDFRTRTHMTDHVKVHTGEKPFECEICLRKFAQRTSLTVHYRTHSGDKPYKCSLCEKSYIQKSHLVRHQRNHHSTEH